MAKNYLDFSVLKTVEMTIDFRKNTAAPTHITLSDSSVEGVESSHFLDSP